MQLAGAALWMLLSVFGLLLLVRLVGEVVHGFARNWRATGLVAVGLEVVYTATDPPVKLARRKIRPLRFGGFGFDIAFLVVLVVVYVARTVVWYTMVA